MNLRRDEQSMNILSECFRHLTASDIGYSMEREAIVNFIISMQVLANRVYDQAQEVRILVHQESDGEVTLLS